MNKNKKLLLLTSIICLLPTLAGIILYTKLPDQIPVQWGAGGDVSSFAPRWFPVAGISVVCSGLSFAVALEFSMSTAGIVGFFGVIFIILGWYIYGTSINSIAGILLPWSSAESEIRIKAQQLCMRVFIAGGIASTLFSLMGYSILAFFSLLAALIVSFAGAGRICS